jgi:hypothetical protein
MAARTSLEIIGHFEASMGSPTSFVIEQQCSTIYGALPMAMI